MDERGCVWALAGQVPAIQETTGPVWPRPWRGAGEGHGLA